MRHLITGLVAAVAVVAASAVPAMACGGGLFQSTCSPCGYVDPCGGYAQTYAAPVYAAPTYSYGYGYSNYSGCNSCGGWAHERLAEPVQQYYYVNQGPTYTGAGDWAPEPTYQEGSYYSGGYEGYRHHSYRPYRPYGGYYHPRRSYGYGYGYGYGHRSYAPRHYGYGAGYGMPHYGYGHALRRYY